jgi:hypothetical protein
MKQSLRAADDNSDDGVWEVYKTSSATNGCFIHDVVFNEINVYINIF